MTNLIQKKKGEVWSAVHHSSEKYYALKKSTQKFRGSRDKEKFLREIGALLCLI